MIEEGEAEDDNNMQNSNEDQSKTEFAANQDEEESKIMVMEQSADPVLEGKTVQERDMMEFFQRSDTSPL